MTQPQVDYDSAWKEVLERYFKEFIAFFFPPAYEGIDWETGYEFLDKELQQVVRDAELGRRYADKLVKVWSLDGQEARVLVHVEVQGEVDRDLPKRLYVYNYRIFDRYDRRVVSLAVLADNHPTWKPQSFGYELWGCKVRLDFPVIKLLDYTARWDMLEQDTNPFAIIVMAHLKTQATHHDTEDRLHWKLTLVKMLYRRGYSKTDILELFRFIDWLMILPEEAEAAFAKTLREFEEDMKMPYVTSVERQGIKQGMKQGVLEASREAVVDILEVRFENVPPTILDAVNELEDLSRLRMLRRKAATIASMEEFRQFLGE